MSRKALMLMNASVMYPSSSKFGTAQGTNTEHELSFAIDGTRSTNQWYSASGAPTTTNGAAYQVTARSLRSAPTSRMTASGYMQMRWYQHSSHGRNPMISE